MSLGHAGTATACTAVSAILTALAGYIHNQDGGGAATMEKGRALIFVSNRCSGMEAVMDMAVIGLLQIAKAEPDSVKVEVFGR